MGIISLPARAFINQIAEALLSTDSLHPDGDTVFLSFADIPAMDVLAFLGAWGLMARSNGTTIKLRGEAKTLAALQLMGFQQLLDIPPSSTKANVQPAKASTVSTLR